jgi:hypothetical protein
MSRKQHSYAFLHDKFIRNIKDKRKALEATYIIISARVSLST